MKTAIDRAGRVVIPAKLRAKANLRPGAPLEIHYSDGAIVIEPAPLSVSLERRGSFLVAVADDHVPPMTDEDVRGVREALREDRANRKAGRAKTKK